MNVQDLAREASSYFERALRDSSDPDSGYVRTKNDTPEWVTNVIYEAHAGMLPDDWRYDQIENALDVIADSDDPDDARGEFADGAVDVYNSDRIAWLASHGNRQSYCDDAASEFGSESRDVIEMIGLGQYYEAGEIYGLVLQALEARTDDDE
jgi:hypothetical protein